MVCEANLNNFLTERNKSYRYFRGIHKHETQWLKHLSKMYKNFCVLGSDKDRDSPLIFSNDSGEIQVNYDTLQSRCKKRSIQAAIMSINGCNLSILSNKPKKCKKMEAHANLFIIDSKKKILVRYEPQGLQYAKQMYNIKKLDEQLKKVAKKLNLKYIAPKKFQSKYGPQLLENKYVDKHKISTRDEGAGYCSIWSMMFLHHYILLHDCMSLKQIMNKTMPRDDHSAYENVRNYTQTVVKTCKIMKP